MFGFGDGKKIQSIASIASELDSSLYFAHWETPSKMRAYLDLAGFDQDE
jgi:hypothetical protein